MERCGDRWNGSARMDMSRLAIVAAMEREVAPLVRGWKVREIEHGGRRYRIFENRAGENGDAVLICGGIGAEAARRATEAVIQETRPGRVLSVGFAGALDSTMKVADVLEPRVVVNAADGARTETGSGQGTLVSYASVSDRDQKQRLARAYGAIAVDMEAGAVAQGAQARGIEFAALKVISDAADFRMPPVERFVSSEGQFRSAQFAMHVAVRPWLWGRTIALARNSTRASRALCTAIENYLKRGSVNRTNCDPLMNPPKQSLGGAPSVS
jgi:adenosylhomocysteine nucleosidase